MRYRKWIVGVLTLALALSGGSLTYAAKQGGRAGKAAKAGPVQQQIKLLEKALGTPLTEKQKEDVGAAHKAYQESLAKAVGLTDAELKAKLKEMRDKERAARQANKPARANKKKKADTPAAPAAAPAQ